MARPPTPVTLVVHTPSTTDGKLALTDRIAAAQATAVHSRIEGLDCSTEDKHRILAAVIRQRKSAATERA